MLAIHSPTTKDTSYWITYANNCTWMRKTISGCVTWTWQSSEYVFVPFELIQHGLSFTHRRFFFSILFIFSIGSICRSQYWSKWKVKCEIGFFCWVISRYLFPSFCRCWTNFILVSYQILSGRSVSTVGQWKNYVVSTIETRLKTWTFVLFGRRSGRTRFTHCTR